MGGFRNPTWLVAGLAGLLTLAPRAHAGHGPPAAPCAPPSSVECVQGPAPKVVVEMSPPEVTFKAAPPTAVCQPPQPTACPPANTVYVEKACFLKRLLHHQPAAPVVVQAPAAPVMLAPVAAQPVMAAPVYSAPLVPVAAAPVAAPMLAPVASFPVAAAPSYAPAAPVLMQAPVQYAPVQQAPACAPAAPTYPPMAPAGCAPPYAGAPWQYPGFPGGARAPEEGDVRSALAALDRLREGLASRLPTAPSAPRETPRGPAEARRGPERDLATEVEELKKDVTALSVKVLKDHEPRIKRLEEELRK